MYKVSVVIANYNGEKFLRDCIDSLLTQTYSDFEIVLVDDRSTDLSVSLIENTYRGILRSRKLKLITSETNRGFAHTNNIGAKYATGSTYICLLNNDTIVAKDALQELVTLMDTHANIGGATGMIMDKGHEKDMYESIIAKEYKPVHSPIFSTVYIPQTEADQEFIHVDGISGCFFMYRRALVEEPFKDYYRAYGEDTYLSLLIRSQGYSLAMIPHPHITHRGSASYGQRPSVRKVYHGVKNEIINMFFFSSRSSFRIKLPALMFYHMVKFFLGGGSIRMRGTWIGYKRFFAHKRFLKQERKGIKKHMTFHGQLFSSRNIFGSTYGPGENIGPVKTLGMYIVNAIARLYLTLFIHDKKD